jgi:DNA-binding transcriptional MerR regulator
MGNFSISQLSQFSGVKPHTLRAWEIRYQALKPSRSRGNTRYYDSTQMKRLMVMVSLVRAGYKVSEVAPLPDHKLHQLQDAVFSTNNNQTESYFISQLISAGMSYDTARFERIFGHCLVRYRLKNMYQLILLPMLERVGMMWRCDKASPTHEHFVSNLVRQKLLSYVDALPRPEPGAEKWLLFLPENEFHELGLLLAYNLIRLSGHGVVYLGSNVPWTALPAVVKETSPDKVLFFSLSPELPKGGLGHLRELGAAFTGRNIYMAGNTQIPCANLKESKIISLKTVEELTAVLTQG